jgi:hypothetical protein
MMLFNYRNGTKLSILGMMNYTTLIERVVDIRLILKCYKWRAVYYNKCGRKKGLAGV